MCCVQAQSLNPVQLFTTLWAVARQAPLSMGFSSQEYCSGLPCPPPGALLDPGIEPMSPASAYRQADSLALSHLRSPNILLQLSRSQHGDVQVARSCPTLQPHGLTSPWNSPGQNPGVGSLSLLQGIFPTQGSNPGLPPCRRILYQLSIW